MNVLISHLRARAEDLSRAPAPQWVGQVQSYDGVIVSCGGFPAPIGARCAIDCADGSRVLGEVTGFDGAVNRLFLDRGDARITHGAEVRLLDEGHDIAAGRAVLGRVLDAEGAPLDGGERPHCPDRWPLAGKAQNPLTRRAVDMPLDVGIRILNAALTIGRGQRVGIMAGSGVGKSVLIEMMARATAADVIIIGLIGERAREVGAFARQIMGDPATAAKTCIIAVPADRSPLLRLRAANRATALAEYFREAGAEVMLVMDSLTRVAHARRELGLALGEQPTARGYPPSALSMIPSLIERAGAGQEGQGAITAFYTILADGDDVTSDPVVDTARAILDGHIVLSRAQAQMGIYPAIDIRASVSRVMDDITDPAHQAAALRLKRLVALYMENRDMMLMGAYQAGQDTDLDQAVRLWPKIVDLISQRRGEACDLRQARAALLALFEESPAT